MTRLARWLSGIATLLLAAAFALPLWHIKLLAPQYPEGLGLEIHIHTVRGMSPTDLGNINELNHYIGMKVIDPDAIPVLHIMPWVLGALVLGGLLVTVIGRRGALIAWLGGFLVAAGAGMWEFWRWEYDYGHNLDFEHAIIKVPGMTYQPPLLGAKQLLNFTAISWPATGGVLIGIALALGIVALVLSLRARRVAGQVLAATALGAAACSAGPRPIAYDQDACAWCRMLISDPRYGSELVMGTGKTVVFDSIDCLASYYDALPDRSTVHSLWVSDYEHPGTLIPARDAYFVHFAGPGSPMGRGLLAVPAAERAQALALEVHGGIVRWNDVLALARRGVEGAGAAAPGDDSPSALQEEAARG